MEPTLHTKEEKVSTEVLENSNKQKNEPGFWKETLRFTFLALIIVIPFRIFIAQPFLVNGASMEPTFENGNYLIVDQLSYRFTEPKRGSVLIFKYPVDPKKYFIKRIIGLPGETVKINGGKITIINNEHSEGFELTEEYITFPKNDTQTTEVKNGEYFVMGDNRAGSLDSRYWGTLKEEYIIGRPIFQLFPLQEISVWPGEKNLSNN